MTESEARSKIKYRIGVIREIAGTRFDSKIVEDLEIAIQALKEIREYRAIGTVEELKAFKEKNVAKEMSIGNDNGKSRRCCGNCGCFVLPASNYCSKCGQKLDWEGGAE